MKTWTPAPPDPARHVVKVEKPDWQVFQQPMLMHRDVTRAVTTNDGYSLSDAPAGSSWAMGGVFQYLITFSDGVKAMADYATLQVILSKHGQDLNK